MRKRQMLEHDDASHIADAARRAALEAGIRVAIAIVDDGGRLLRFERMDGVAPITVDAAIDKARSASLTQRDTRVWQERVLDRPNYLRLPILPIEGGIVIRVGDECVGGLGISGGTADEDGRIATAALAALGAGAGL